MIVETVVAATKITSIMQDNSVNTLTSIVEAKVDTIVEFVDQQYRLLDAYSVNSDMMALIDDPTNETLQEAAEEFTLSMAEVIPNLDSLLFTDYEGTARTHNVPSLIGYQNDEETVELIKIYYFLNPPTPQYSMTAIASPATGDVTLLFMKSLYDSNDNAAGYVCLGLTVDKINEMLGSIDVSSKQHVSLVADGNGTATVIYDDDSNLVTTTLESGPMYDLAVERAEASETGAEVAEASIINYIDETTGEGMIGYYKYLPDYGWTLFVSASESSLYDEAQSSAIQIVVVALIVVIFIVLILTFIIKRMLDPLTNVQNALSEVANYNLNVTDGVQKYRKKSDEVGKLANATFEVVEMLKAAVNVLRNSSNSLNDSSANLGDTSKKLVDVANENSAITNQFSASIQQTGASVKLVNEEINKIVDLVNEVVEKVKLGEVNAERLITETEEINSSIDANIANNETTIAETLAAMQAAMESLEEVKKVNELADAIMDITSRTNLLSLNASIEAARAGEAGRGFAVVAGEIGQLADQSRDTAMDIQKIVEASNQAIDNVREQVNALTEYVKNDVTETYEGFANQSRAYGDGVGEIRKTVDEIGKAMSGLEGSIDGIAHEISAVANASAENNNGVNDIMDKNEETSRITSDIERLAQTSKANADDLEGIVSKFSL